MKWDKLEKILLTHNKKDTEKMIEQKETWLNEITFTYLYPRLDANVSKGINHLLKSPWCVHPKTGKICVPFNSAYVDRFDPNECPTLTNVLNEYNRKAATSTKEDLDSL